MGRVVRSFRLLPLLFALLAFARAHADTINFEGLADGTPVGSYYSGITFTNATILTAGISLNEAEFPPHSGLNVVTDDGSPIRISFSLPVSAFSAYFTYASPLLLSAFDSNGILLGSVTSAFLANYTTTGNSPNELLDLAFSGIASVLVAGDPAGGSFAMDDMSYTIGGPITPPPPPVTTTPEPPAFVLLATGMFALVLLQSGRVFRFKTAI